MKAIGFCLLALVAISIALGPFFTEKKHVEIKPLENPKISKAPQRKTPKIEKNIPKRFARKIETHARKESYTGPTNLQSHRLFMGKDIEHIRETHRLEINDFLRGQLRLEIHEINELAKIERKYHQGMLQRGLDFSGIHVCIIENVGVEREIEMAAKMSKAFKESFDFYSKIKNEYVIESKAILGDEKFSEYKQFCKDLAKRTADQFDF